MSPYRIVIADDHRLLRQGVKKIIEERPDLKVIGEANDGIELLGLLKKLSPDMAIVDISMPNLEGIEATREIRFSLPHIKILMLTMHKDADHLAQAISAGVDGYILKEDADTELYSAIDTIRQGEHYISPLLSREVKDSFIQVLQRPNGSPSEELTPREGEVLVLIAQAKSSKEIAGLLNISVRTAENHRKNIMKKLGLKKNIQLVRYAISKGYISIAD
jgi:DNA-binding NarL/FixJ family response regulator